MQRVFLIFLLKLKTIDGLENGHYGKDYLIHLDKQLIALVAYE
jgi:hypothetical protein